MTTDGGGGPPSLSPHFGEDGDLHYGDKREKPQTPESFVQGYDFQMILDPQLQLAYLDYTTEHKIAVAERVLKQLDKHSLQLACDNPRVYLMVQSSQPGTIPDGRKTIEFTGVIMFFTNRGPMRFTHNFSILDRNAHTLPDPDQPAEVPGAIAVMRSLLDRVLRRR